ncbi:hypothetical protein TVAG_028460 [Trichomonas vaginalis G3]|uniref:Uncharacterized protein n=1 Tax=Trichomonas vaginalis (strain ATCC PRA-98 / G3) TaxID=412133 RepID=A2E093_TRIV3|nr:hypothetical protein TVAGG3_0556990 [Trichomonas vaginalis G3]EAY13893.1 hypothetical protein TVAG_028460 [Trichomonas vaginalis G3]KAI5520923.1 hypothetical protein TVAGG3_0556990 [Trichomonas vaginalis G3]|eukprot:XP_001326116.1 hypothetical protein [Trichomonas vaginalis G3]
MRTRNRTPLQSLCLDILEQLIQPESFAKNQYLVSHVDDKNCIKISNLLGAREFFKARVDARELALAIKSSPEFLKQYIKSDLFKLPFVVDTKSLILQKVPNDLTVNQMKIFIYNLTGTQEKVCEKKNSDMHITFPDFRSCIAFWRALNYCMLEGHHLSAIISLTNVPDRLKTMSRSQSMQFKSKSPIPRPEKLPHLQITLAPKDTNFPKNE